MMTLRFLAALLALNPATFANAKPAAPAPALEHVFTVRATVQPPVEQGEIDGKRTRFIGIAGGSVDGPKLKGEVLPGGGDWQKISKNGLTEVMARYFLKAKDGTVIGVTNAGVRVAPPEIAARLAQGEDVDPSLYYFRTTPTFEVSSGSHEWLRHRVLVARGIRKPDHVLNDFYEVK